MLKVKIREFTDADIKRITEDGLNGEYIAEDSKIVEYINENSHKAVLYVEDEIIQRLGIEYMQNNTTLEYSEICEQWFAKLSQNNYYNDLKRFPPKLIKVIYIENKCGEDTEIYQNIESGQYYMRFRHNEPFARWMSCRKDSRYGWTDVSTIRANITFKHNDQTETITYDDWNGHAAYSNTFNPKF